MQLLDPNRGVEEQGDNESPSKTRAEERAKIFQPMRHQLARTALWIILLAGLLTFFAMPSSLSRFRRFQQELRNWSQKQPDNRLFCLQHLSDGNWHRVSSMTWSASLLVLQWGFEICVKCGVIRTACKSHIQQQCSTKSLSAAYCGFFQYAELGDRNPVTMEDKTKHVEWNWEPQVTKRCCFTALVEEEVRVRVCFPSLPPSPPKNKQTNKIKLAPND